MRKRHSLPAHEWVKGRLVHVTSAEESRIQQSQTSLIIARVQVSRSFKSM
jgi:hypothetical protein